MKHRIRMRHLYVLIFSLIIGLSGSVQAACLQSDMSGTWFTYSVGPDFTNRCKVIVNSAGRFFRSSSYCIYHDWSTAYISGQMSLRSGCYLSIGKVHFYTFSGSYLGYDFVHYASLDSGKTIISGAGFGATRFIITGTKR